jgi:fused signal recognition particle receptor
VLERQSEPATPEPELEPEPAPEPLTPAAELEAEPEAEPDPEPPHLEVVPEPEPELEPEPEPEPEPELPRVVTLPISATPREWNVWELERLARSNSGGDAAKDEELSYLLVYLRDFASAEGTLPVDFDALVRESFGPLLAVR